MEDGHCVGVAVGVAARVAEAESEAEGVNVGRGHRVKMVPGLPGEAAQEVPAAPPAEKSCGVAFFPSVTLRQ